MMVQKSCLHFNASSIQNVSNLPDEILSRITVVLGSEYAKDVISMHMIEGMGPKHRNVDLFIRTCAAHNNIVAMFIQGAEKCLCNGNFDVGMTLLRQLAYEDHLEAIYLLGTIYISTGPPLCDQGVQLLHAYFCWAVLDHGEYIGVVDSVRQITSHSNVKRHLILLNGNLR
uniref:At2g35280-like TPR domain-containing protein n=1 Tax=Lactuca sativa TaxID=4236 RepID=A0A9R1VGD8_LACSA|nr:hypothetical protein LSAT_V11C500286680 [Lactuca sativa]